MNRRISPEKFLSIWEQIWGELSDDWRVSFLNDPRIERILTFPDSSIQLALLNNKKLDEVISFLEKNSSAEATPSNKSPNRIKSGKSKRNTDSEYPSNAKENSEYSIIYDWLREFSNAELDPENTFPRLLIKSDRDTCQKKVSYTKEKDAIFALINLGKKKGALIKQLPYKCNICRSYHNTHLISRETIHKLLGKYGKFRE